ncbi:MAG TPA: 16S rRNA (cytosine(1402)-N(4))-methyltransferase RsmH [Candidatus Kapabacteria bacterium]|nr:16S rRNA (cytosine(1402)-N(4))-methyltransferase RsmH [Candidatus Kapabacteria bacterium]
MTTSEYHEPVLLSEAMEYLAVHESGIYVDATLGGGGYSEAILMRGARVFGFDTDPAAQQFASGRLAKFGERFVLVKENFAQLQTALKNHPILFKEGEGGWLDGIVYDLGVSSHQLDTTSVGLSYRVEAPLDMRLDPRAEISARNVIAEYDEARLRNIFRRYGEEPYAGPIARKIVRARSEKSIETTTELAEVIANGIRKDKRNETLSRIFQAIRIEVNHELENLQSSLEQAVEMLRSGGRIVVVSYHSLEDRIVKEFFKNESAPQFSAGAPGALKSRIDLSRARLKVLTKKPVTPSAEELARNPRARSAKLRAAGRITN